MSSGNFQSPIITSSQSPAQAGGWWSRNWKWFAPVGCLTVIALFAAFVAILVFVVMGAIKSTDAYKLALDKAQKDARVQQRLGTPHPPRPSQR